MCFCIAGDGEVHGQGEEEEEGRQRLTGLKAEVKWQTGEEEGEGGGG